MTRLALNKPILTIGGKRPAGNGAGTRFVPINPEAFIAHSIVPWVGCRTGVYRSDSSTMPRRPGENWLPADRCAQLSECAAEPARQSHSLRFHMEFAWREVRYLCPSTRCGESREARTAIRTSETGAIRGSVAHRTLMEKKLVQQLIFIQIHIFPAPIYLATYCAADDPFAADASKIFPRLWRKKMPMRRVL